MFNFVGNTRLNADAQITKGNFKLKKCLKPKFLNVHQKYG